MDDSNESPKGVPYPMEHGRGWRRVAEIGAPYLVLDDEDPAIARGTTRLSSKNQITLPAYLLREMGMEAGDRVAISREGSRLILRARPKDWVKHYGGSLPGTYGETAYVDADLLELINERINVGRGVALAKINSDPSIRDILSDTAALTARLRDSRREEEVLAAVTESARRYGVDEGLARDVFRWVIDRVLELEVVYLQRLTDR